MTHQDMFGAAQWIGCGREVDSACIRASVVLPKVQMAQITICGLGYFQLYINGIRVSEDLFIPVTSDYAHRDIMVNGQPFDEEMRHRCYCLKYSLAHLLKEGKNELAVELGQGFFATPTWSFDEPVRFGPLRLCYRMEWMDAEGNRGEALSGTDAKWMPGIVETCEFFQGEKQDLRKCPENWPVADAADWEDTVILPPLETQYQYQDCPADRIIRQITPRFLRETAQGKLYDAGENISGWVVLKDQSASGDEIAVRFSEMLDEAGNLHATYMHQQYLDVISDGTGRIIHPMHTWHAFRYFTVQGQADVVSVAVIHSDVPVTSAFASASPVLNWLYQAYTRTQLCNMHGGIPSDCPHLERRGYTGDGQLACEAALMVLNHQEFLRKWMRDIQDCQDIHSGHVQNTAPYTRCGGGPGGWGCAIVTVPYQYYRQYGDAQPLSDMYDGMCHYLEYLKNHSEQDLVTSDRPGEWCLGDWCPPGNEEFKRVPPRIPEPFVNTYFLVKSLELMVKIEEILGKSINPAWKARKEGALHAIIREYYDPETGDFCKNVEGANAFALDIGLGDERTLQHMIAHYQATGCYDTGIFGTEIVTRVLLEKGESPLAFQLMNSEKDISFAGWMRAGATTLWEYWPRGYQRSLSHPMFGAVVKELFHYGLGIRQMPDSAGWKKVCIAPAWAEELPWAQGKIQTPLGDVCVSYQYWEGTLSLEVQVPSGMEAYLQWQGNDMRLESGLNKLQICK